MPQFDSATDFMVIFYNISKHFAILILHASLYNFLCFSMSFQILLSIIFFEGAFPFLYQFSFSWICFVHEETKKTQLYLFKQETNKIKLYLYVKLYRELYRFATSLFKG